jgi:SAM-dependent methyltransferase
MAWWTDRMLPYLIDWALRAPEVNDRRRRACRGLAGRVLEVGFGSGLNLRYYPEATIEVLVVDPSGVAHRLAEPRIARRGLPVRQVGLDGSAIDLPDGSVDAALSTFTLCTIPDVSAALAEVRRVLRPGAALHFLEHGRSPDLSVRRWQRRLNPVQRRLVGGCHLDRSIPELVTAAGFEVVELRTGYGVGPRPFSYLFEGRALSV